MLIKLKRVSEDWAGRLWAAGYVHVPVQQKERSSAGLAAQTKIIFHLSGLTLHMGTLERQLKTSQLQAAGSAGHQAQTCFCQP